ncbi:hypothetical protein BC937DRAFT_93184 [Endogone sp. FLAS-F59071]|nr:hypothetical protein BC937DRAFT_93184 [Endogone sp. FLAS-F59071]|eukprot:RUS14891.1 hypothetical protein BC937DRAFT_93184 [Endogone sp. FLAS-F59071]
MNQPQTSHSHPPFLTSKPSTTKSAPSPHSPTSAPIWFTLCTERFRDERPRDCAQGAGRTRGAQRDRHYTTYSVAGLKAALEAERGYGGKPRMPMRALEDVDRKKGCEGV